MKRNISLRTILLAVLLLGMEVYAVSVQKAEHDLELVIRCDEKDLKRGDEIPIVFTITNTGSSVYFYYEEVGRYNDRGSLMGQYELIVSDESGRLVEDPLESRYREGYGGSSAPRTGIEPDESFSRTVPLNQWALIKEPGRYTVTGVYHTGVFHLSKKSPSVMSGPIQNTVRPRSDETLQMYIDGLSERLDSFEVPETGMTRTAWTEIESVVRKLGYTCDARVVPVLLDTAYMYPHSDLWVTDAILHYVGASPEIREKAVATARARGLPGGSYSLEYLLEQLGCREEEFKEIIGVCLRSGQGSVQSAGAHAAQRHPDDEQTQRLIEIATDPNNEARIEAGRALACNRTDEGVKVLKKLLKDESKSVRENIKAGIRHAYVDVRSYGERPDDEYLAELIGIINDSNSGDWALFRAVREIVKTRSKRGVETLKRLVIDPDMDVAGGQVDEGVKAVKGLLNSPDQKVREGTANVIRSVYESFPGRTLRKDDFPELYIETVEARRESLSRWLEMREASGADVKVDSKRPAKWAKKVTLDGVGNFHKVSDVIYRSEQPTPAGMKALEKMGIKTIVNLRSFHSDRDEMKGTKMGYEHITMKAWHAEEKEIVRFLKIVTNKQNQPVLVHCQHGADRTGTMCAIYRIAVQNWTRDEAIEEMTKGGFGYHSIWKNLIDYIEALDIEKIKQKAGLKN
jgi:tyrosine-protein phosphatase SIW14